MSYPFHDYETCGRSAPPKARRFSWAFYAIMILAASLFVFVLAEIARGGEKEKDRGRGTALAATEQEYTILAEDDPSVESTWTDQPQFMPNMLMGTLLFDIQGQPYILLNGLKRSGEFREFFFTNFPGELFRREISQYILGRKVFFNTFQGYVDSWGFADKGIRERIDKYFFDLYGE